MFRVQGCLGFSTTSLGSSSSPKGPMYCYGGILP